jgi:glycosyltransferase involved in cell wall biosynthesis
VNISVVIPVYNSQPTLVQLVAEVESVLSVISDQYEIILVNDGSTDESWLVIERLCAQIPQLRALNMMRNFGQHNAVLAGIRQAKCEVTVTLDDDLQNPCSEIPKLVACLSEGYDVAYGRPKNAKQDALKNVASQVTKLLLKNAMGVEAARNISPFRAFRTHIREAFSEYRGPFVFIDVLLTWGAARFTAVPVEHRPRRIGRSGYTLATLITLTLNMVTGFSSLPLRLASVAGLLAMAFGFLILVYVVTCYMLLGYSVPGFPFLASIVSIFAGVQLFCLGVIGEYLARMHARSMDRPPYFVREEIGGGVHSVSSSIVKAQESLTILSSHKTHKSPVLSTTI